MPSIVVSGRKHSCEEDRLILTLAQFVIREGEAEITCHHTSSAGKAGSASSCDQERQGLSPPCAQPMGGTSGPAVWTSADTRLGEVS